MDHQKDPAQMMAIQVETLFVLDRNERLVGINSDEDTPAPRFFFGSTENGNLWRFRHDLPSSVVSELDELCTQEPVRANLRDAPLQLEAFRKILDEHEKILRFWTGPAYWIPAEDLPSSAGAVRIDAGNIALLKESFPDVERRMESCQPIFAVVSGGRAVSVCMSTRIGRQAHEAGVETLEPHRGKGYASVVTSAWTAEVHRLGRIPFYSTSWENAASQGVARRLGARLFGVDLHFT